MDHHRYLLTNGLGGYSSLTRSFCADRCDAGVFVAALRAPDLRINMVHRIKETLIQASHTCTLSGQHFADDTPAEDGTHNLKSFSLEPEPCWHYEAAGVQVERTLSMAYGENTCCLLYRVENGADTPCTLTVQPFFKLAPKETPLTAQKAFTATQTTLCDGTYTLYISANAPAREHPAQWQTLSYPEDEKDGRPGWGMAFACRSYDLTVQPGQEKNLTLVFSCRPDAPEAETIINTRRARRQQLLDACPLSDPVARQLYMAADDFIVRRDSTGGKTIVAGYPLFSDWGRDTMIALTGCALTTRRYEDAKSILRTFLAYEKDGLVPNLFPEGGSAPRYNTVDAALLLIDCVWQYFSRTGDLAFVQEAFPVLVRIIDAYRRGTRHGIGMDTDGLIFAGEGLDQVTWMDVCVQGILPTPRHGKPVEINAYWYNALRIMAELARLLGESEQDWAALAEQVKASFRQKFYMPDQGYLKDVLSNTDADMQLRCNQIWAVSMPFGMLTPAQERSVVEAVTQHLYTSRGLRTLSPQDPQYRGQYGGSQFDRDMAYHQGTTWVFPLGGYCLAWLKVHGHTPAAAKALQEMLQDMQAMLREGCIGQLPEIYDGDCPAEGKGCYAQAWSVGELLRVYEAMEHILK